MFTYAWPLVFEKMTQVLDIQGNRLKKSLAPLQNRPNPM